MEIALWAKNQEPRCQEPDKRTKKPRCQDPKKFQIKNFKGSRFTGAFEI